jgi:hypothetical protein
VRKSSAVAALFVVFVRWSGSPSLWWFQLIPKSFKHWIFHLCIILQTRSASSNSTILKIFIHVI